MMAKGRFMNFACCVVASRSSRISNYIHVVKLCFGKWQALQVSEIHWRKRHINSVISYRLQFDAILKFVKYVKLCYKAVELLVNCLIIDQCWLLIFFRGLLWKRAEARSICTVLPTDEAERWSPFSLQSKG